MILITFVITDNNNNNISSLFSANALPLLLRTGLPSQGSREDTRHHTRSLTLVQRTTNTQNVTGVGRRPRRNLQTSNQCAGLKIQAGRGEWSSEREGLSRGFVPHFFGCV